jgi:molecular chaperone GrpE
MNEENKIPAEETVDQTVEQTAAQETAAQETAEAAGSTEAKDGKKAKKNAKADALAAELEAAKAEAAKTKDLFLRTAAEYDNYRKRTTKEREAAFGNGVAHAVEKLLPVIDTLEMAAAAATADENYKKGVTMTLTKAYAVLKDMGVEEIPAQDQPFDPNVHSAMMQQPTEGVEPGTVVQVFQKGYTLNGRVIRHAMVVVSA